MSETLTIVLKADGSGLTGTVKASADAIRQFGLQADQAGRQVEGAGARSRGAARGIDDVGRSAKGSESSLRGLVGGLNTLHGTLATLGVGLLVREMLGAGLAMDRLERSTAAAVGSQTLAGRELGFVRTQAERLGIYFPTLAEGYAGLAAATRGTNLAGAKTREIFLGVVEAGRAMNLSNERIAGTLNALQQIAGKGTVSMEELRQQLGDRLPGAMQIAAKSMGYTVAEFIKLVSEGKILSEDFLPKFAKGLREASAAGVDLAKHSPAAEFGRLKTALFDLGVATARGGVLDTLATGAKALTAALNAVVASGAVQTITSLLGKLAGVAVVAFIGRLIGNFVLLRGSMIAASIETIRYQASLLRLNGITGVAAARAIAHASAVQVGAMAMRGMSLAMAALGGPVGVAITAVTLLATWLYTSRQAAEETARALREGFKGARQAMDEFNRTPSLAASFTLADAKIGETMDKIRARLVDLRVEQQALAEQSSRSLARFGFADPRLADGMRANGEEMKRLTGQINGLQLGSNAAAENITDLTLRTAGLAAVAPEARRELMGVSQEVAQGKLELTDALPKWQAIIARFGDAGAAARVTADGIYAVVTAASGATEVVDGLAKNLAKLNIRMAGLQGGSAAEIKRRVGYEILEKGGPAKMTPAELAAIGQGMKAEIALTQQVEEAQAALVASRKAATAATREHAKATREGIRDDNAAAQATRALNDLIRDQQNEYAGPVKQAANDYAEALQRIQKVQDNLTKAHRLDADALAQLQTARTEAAKANDRNVALAEREAQALVRKQDLVGQAVRDYNDETRAVAGSAREHSVQEAILRAEDAAREQYRKGQRESIDLTLEEAKAIRAGIEAGYGQRKIADEAAQAAEDYKRNWGGAIGSVAGAMGDFFASGLRDSKSFTEGLKDIFKRWLSNVIAIFADGALKRAFGSVAQSVSGWLSNMAGGGGGGSGGMWSSLLSAFTGGGGASGGMLSGMYSAFTNGFSATGAAGGGFWSSLVSGFSGAVSAFTGSLATAGAATGAYGTMISGLAALPYGAAAGSGFAASGGVATAGLGAAAGVSWIPIVGWIVAGIMASSAAFKNGWKIDGQKSDMTEYYAKKGMIAASVATATVGAADQLLRSLGFKDSWAAALSGSSLHTKLWGHKTPKVMAQGIQGSIGFGGFDGQSTADIKAKGGWFRSDKKWTETGALDSTIDRAFDNAAQGIAARTADLAKQMGVDISASLAAVKIDLGEMNFDADPKKAREQIAEKIAELMEGLSAEAVKALGFARLLDDGFQASEIMGALSASIALVTGGADKLGRALSTLEIENVARAVEYFESLAIKNGSSLGDEVQRVVGLLGEYSSLITGVDTELQTRGLNQYQSAQLQIELQYRNQVKQANTLAKALGLSGARAEDLAKIEQLRAVNMASLQTQMEAQKNTFLQDLGLSDLSVLTDAQKLAESMQLLRDAVGAGDLQRAQGLSQTALGLGRNLYASGADYSGLYGEVTGLLGGMNPAGLEGFTDLQLDNIADILTGLPDGIASAMFNLLYGPATPLPPAPVAPPPPGGGGGGAVGGGGGGGGGGLGGGGNDDGIYAVLQQISANTGGVLRQQADAALWEYSLK